MNADKVEGIAFRFTRAELGALLKLMNAPVLPGTDIAAAEPDEKAEMGLLMSGIIMPAGEKTYVDRVVALTLLNAIRSRRFMKSQSLGGAAVLYEGAQMCVLAQNSGRGLVTVEPIETLRAAKGPWMHAVSKLGKPAKTVFQDGANAYALEGNEDSPEAVWARLKEQ